MTEPGFWASEYFAFMQWPAGINKYDDLGRDQVHVKILTIFAFDA